MPPKLSDLIYTDLGSKYYAELVGNLEDECDRLRQALQVIVDPPMGDDAADPDDVAREALRLQSPAFNCLKCFPGDDCPQDCLGRNHRVTDN